jgi:AAA15 family ATPase/GTPase
MNWERVDIIKYKLFENFFLKDFSQINIITGPNNVGKTALLEVLFLGGVGVTPEGLIGGLGKIFKYRNFSPYPLKIKERFLDFLESLGEINIKFDDRELKIKLNKNTIESTINVKVDNKELEIELDKLKPLKIDDFIKNVNYIPSCFDERALIEMYSEILKESKEDELNELISKFDNRIKKFKIIPDEQLPLIEMSDKKTIPFSEFGEGFKRFLFYVVAAFNSKNGILLIDEIENGVWYKQFDFVLDNLVKLTKELNIQLFFTTHSYEIIKSFINLGEKNSVLIEMGINKKIDYILYSYEEMLEEIENFKEVRGWK